MNFKLKNIKKSVMHVMGGTILTEDFFMKNTRFMLVVFVLIVLYISNRYSCISKMAEIESLRRELKDAKYESLTISSELTGISRQSQVESLLEKNGVDLITPTDPAYKIKVE
jgi:cell division protein FtsL